MHKITRSKRTCSCGKCTHWFDGKTFRIKGPGVGLVLTNISIAKALEEFDKVGSSRAIEAVIPTLKGGNIVHLRK
jgi:hypothetical protein